MDPQCADCLRGVSVYVNDVVSGKVVDDPIRLEKIDEQLKNLLKAHGVIPGKYLIMFHERVGTVDLI